MVDVETRNGVVVAVYKMKQGSPRYAVLKRVKNWEGWELVKGHRDDDEDVATAAEREVMEETGITDIHDVKVLDMQHTWTYTRDGTEIKAEYDAAAVKVPENAHVTVADNPHEEHEDGYFLNRRDAVTMLTHENQKDLLRRIHQQITD